MIVVNLDVMMARRKISLGDLSERIGISPANLSILKNSKGKAIRFSTLNAICEALNCQPGDILEYVRDEANLSGFERSSQILIKEKGYGIEQLL